MHLQSLSPVLTFFPFPTFLLLFCVLLLQFGFMDCSICKVQMDHPSPMIQRVKKPLDDLFTQIKTKALARLAIEKMEKDPKLVDPQSRYFNQPLKYAIDCFA